MQETKVIDKEILEEANRLLSKLGALDYTLNECLLLASTTLKINRLKKEKNAVILAHNYQRPEILFGVADFVADSFALSVEAKKTTADIIVFCGVQFMAETAKILNHSKKVLIPSLEAGCSLSESITGADVRMLKAQHPKVPVVCYVNTSAEVKAECDVCCTSANALKVIESLRGNEVIFLPDEYMAKNLQAQTKKKLHSWEGRCVVHEIFTPEQIDAYKKQYPDAKVLSHLECDSSVIALSDLAGGTSDMYNYIKNSDAKQFMLVTECGMSDLLRSHFPAKQFITPCSICPYMKKIHLDNVLESLEKEKFGVKIPEDIRVRAQKSLERMLQIGK